MLNLVAMRIGSYTKKLISMLNLKIASILAIFIFVALWWSGVLVEPSKEKMEDIRFFLQNDPEFSRISGKISKIRISKIRNVGGSINSSSYKEYSLRIDSEKGSIFVVIREIEMPSINTEKYKLILVDK